MDEARIERLAGFADVQSAVTGLISDLAKSLSLP
jgi:hypothetical protein